jgi:hypothetical protein
MDYGWIDPKGKFYPCHLCEHIAIAEDVLKSDEQTLERKGYIKITGSIFSNEILIFYFAKGKPTQKQIDTVYNYCSQRNMSGLWTIFEMDYLS